MRIVGGRWRGRRLARPNPGIRPTTDRLREALFNVLGGSVAGSVWVDAFAGSGAVGIEALSRGAAWVIFNDKSSQALRLVRKNLLLCGADEGFEIFQKDAVSLFNELRGRRVDVVFLDPPYDYRRYAKLLAKIAEAAADSRPTVVLVVFKKTPLDFLEPSWILEKTVRAGDSHLLFLALRPRPT